MKKSCSRKEGDGWLDGSRVWELVEGVLHAERVLKHVEGTDDICYDVHAAKAAKKSF